VAVRGVPAVRGEVDFFLLLKDASLTRVACPPANDSTIRAPCCLSCAVLPKYACRWRVLRVSGVGGVARPQMFKIYFKDGAGGWFLPIVLVLISFLTQAVSNVFDYWLSYWSDSYLKDPDGVRERERQRERERESSQRALLCFFCTSTSTTEMPTLF